MWLVFSTFTANTCGSSIIVDYSTKFNLNDSLVSSLYLMWTFFFYLIMFGFFVCFLYLHITYRLLKHYTYFYLLFNFILYLFIFNENFDFMLSNFSLKTVILPDLNINVLLINTLNRYHPFIFYLSVFNMFTLLFILIIVKNQQTDYLVLNFKNEMMIRKCYVTFTFILIAIYLGAWWADQEGSWGGWWNSDSSEMLGMLILILSIIVIHQKNTICEYFTNVRIFILSFFTILCFYYFLQTNYELVSHNFGFKFFFFFNNNLWSLTSIVFIFLLLIVCINKSYVLKYYFYNLKTSYKQYINTKIIFSLLLLIWIIFSVSPVMDTFVMGYQNEQDDLLSDMYSFTKTAAYLFILLSFFNKLKLFKYDSLIVSLHEIPILFSTTLISFDVWNTYKLLHWIILCFLCINVCTDSLLYIYYNTFTYTTTTFINQNMYSFSNPLYLNDCSCFYQFILLHNTTFQLFNIHSPLLYFNSFEYEKNSLVFNNSINFNYLLISWNYNPLCFFIEYAEEGLLSLFTLIVLFLFVIRKSKLLLY